MVLKDDIANEFKSLKPAYSNIHDWEDYSSALEIEYKQCCEQGLDIEMYKDVFSTVAKLPKNEFRNKLGDTLFDIVINAPTKPEHKYKEPSDIKSIKALRKPYEYKTQNGADIQKRIYGAWIGRISGCMLGKTVEGLRTNELIPLLKSSGNYPMHRYINRGDVSDETIEKSEFPFISRPYGDTIKFMPADDDTNYVVLAQEVIEKCRINIKAH